MNLKEFLTQDTVKINELNIRNMYKNRDELYIDLANMFKDIGTKYKTKPEDVLDFIPSIRDDIKSVM